MDKYNDCYLLLLQTKATNWKIEHKSTYFPSNVEQKKRNYSFRIAFFVQLLDSFSAFLLARFSLGLTYLNPPFFSESSKSLKDFCTSKSNKRELRGERSGGEKWGCVELERYLSNLRKAYNIEGSSCGCHNS